MSLYKKIKALGVEDNVSVNFSREEGAEVFHFNETHIETAMSETVTKRSLTLCQRLLKRITGTTDGLSILQRSMIISEALPVFRLSLIFRLLP